MSLKTEDTLRIVLYEGAGGEPLAPENRLATMTASTMCWYPVHRQRFADRASRTSDSVGDGTSFRNAVSVVSMPGVQNPH